MLLWSRRLGDLILVMSGPGCCSWNPQGRVWQHVWGRARCLAPRCLSVGMVSGDDPGNERVLTTEWSGLRGRFVAKEVPLGDLAEANPHLLVWPVALNRICRETLERAKGAAMSKPDVPAHVWLQENTGLHLRGGDDGDDPGRDWSMELVVFMLHRLQATSAQRGAASRNLLRAPLRLGDALALGDFCELEEAPHWMAARRVDSGPAYAPVVPEPPPEELPPPPPPAGPWPSTGPSTGRSTGPGTASPPGYSDEQADRALTEEPSPTLFV